MPNHPVRALALIASLALGACKPAEKAPAVQQGSAAPATDVAAVRAAIDSVNAQFVDEMKRGDSTALALHYDENGMTMPPGEKANVGRGEIQKNLAGMFANVRVTDMKLETTDVVASGDLAVETGRVQLTIAPKKGKPMTEVAKYVVAWRKQADGSWKLYRDIYNADPAPKK